MAVTWHPETTRVLVVVHEESEHDTKKSVTVSVADKHSEVDSEEELLSVFTVPQCAVHVGSGGPEENTVVGFVLSGGQSIENISNSLKHGGSGIGGNEGNAGIGKYGSVDSGIGDQ